MTSQVIKTNNLIEKSRISLLLILELYYPGKYVNTLGPIFTASKDLNPLKKVCQISRLYCVLLGPLWQLKVPLVYLINGQKGGLDCSPLYIISLFFLNLSHK